jgi:hypothetical protein
VVKASLYIFFSIFLVSLANAQEPKISAESDALYFKALPYLEQIDNIQNDYIGTLHRLAANETLPPLKKEQYRHALQAVMKDSIPLLQRSAEAGNPAAQYRLALILSSFEPRDQVAKKVCTLFMSSLRQGFAPAGLSMLYYCLDEIDTAEFRSLIDALPENENLYARYYPQPAMFTQCDADRHAQRDTLVALDEKTFRANLYMGFAGEMSIKKHKQEELRYLGEAVQYGCARAARSLKILTSS